MENLNKISLKNRKYQKIKIIIKKRKMHKIIMKSKLKMIAVLVLMLTNF